MKIDFKEEQRFTQWWLWLILIGIAIVPIYGGYKEFLLGDGVDRESSQIIGLLMYTLIGFGMIVFFLLVRLRTEIDEKEIRMRFLPLVKKSVNWTEVKTAKVVNYGFVGGWGVRFWTKYGTVYNTKGKMGLALELTNGKRFVIGTQKPDELRKILENRPTV